MNDQAPIVVFTSSREQEHLFTPLRILVVEDVPDDAELVILALRQGGLDLVWERVETADGLRAALAAGSWDAVLSDYTMPGFGASTALEIVRAADPDMPFVVVSGTVGDDVAVSTMRAGANDYVFKRNLTRLAPAVRRELRAVENRRAKRAMERAAAHLAAVVESSDDAIISKDLKGAIMSWNPAAERLYGWSAAEAIGRHISFLAPPDKADELAGFMRQLPAGKQIQHFETVRMRRDGSRIDVSLTISPIRNAAGEIVGVSKITRDIRERKRAEESLASSETRYRRLFEAAQDGILIVDAATRHIIDANPFLTDLLGYRRDELVGKELWEIGLFRDAISNKEAFRTVKDLGYIRYDNKPLLAKDGHQIEVEFVSNAYDVGDAEVIQCNIRDVTGRKRAEDAVRVSEERYRTLIAATSAIVWDTPASGAFETEQPGWTAFTGQTFDQLRGRGWLNAVHQDDREHTALAWAAALTERRAYHVEHRLRRADGEYRQMSVGAVPLLNADGAVREWIGVDSDVTDQRRTEVEKVELLTRLQLHIDRMPLAYLLFDAEFRITDCNPAAERIFGYTRREALGMRPADLIPASFRQETTEIAARIRMGYMTAHSVNENLTKDGRTITCEWFNTPLTSPDGKFVGLLCLALDVTSRRHSEEALLLRDRAIRAATQGLLITDPSQPDNPIVYVSPGFERITGYRSEEVLGRNCRFLQGKDTDPAAVIRLRGAIEAGVACSVELLNHGKDGHPFWNELSISPVRDEAGRLTHFVGVQTDVTARRSLEDQFRQAQKMEAFGQLAGGVAHDFNNLLTIINGYSELLLQSLPHGDASRSMVAEIHKAGERSAGLTSQLLAFSRQQILAPRVLNLNEVVTDTDKMLRRLIGEDIRLTTTLDSEPWAIRADSGQIEQVLLNLAVNARDAMPKGGRLTIETRNVELDETYVGAHPDARAGPYVLLSVTDTGSGMPPEVMAKIFEPFFTTKEPGKGTGLGLATVYGIVKQSDGHIAAYSEVGIGTTFKIYLPRIHDAEHEDAKAPSRERAPPRGSETVLIAEDEEGVRALASYTLSACGYQVLAAPDAKEAMRLAAGHHGPIHLLLTDVVMPGVGGRWLGQQLAKLHPDIRVLFVSGYTDDAVIRHGVLRNGVNFLQKPFSPFVLASRVREALDARPATAPNVGWVNSTGPAVKSPSVHHTDLDGDDA
jgi:two-component system, cell cycle sensor histidine kinase and response regulator CckA